MKIEIINDIDLKKVTIKIEDSEEQLSHKTLVKLAKKVINENIDLEVTYTNFEDNLELKESYVNIFDGILKLKEDEEILSLKAEINTSIKKEASDKKE